jgi:deferrochelatase/peroxidase EfeB
MGGAVMKAGEVDFTDVQGLVRFGYGSMKKARYELLRIKDLPAARAWLRSANITTAVAMDPPPKTALQVGFTAPGLRKLGLPDDVIAGFSHEFRGGMAAESRARQLGDVQQNAPENWNWGGWGKEPHLVVMFFGEAGHYDDFVTKTKGFAWGEAFELVVDPLLTSDLDGIEPFGFADGVSQPQIDWEQRRATTHAEFDYTNISALGEFLLGYPNEYGKFTERPLLDSADECARLLPAVEVPRKKDLGRNGTYLVMRQLDQDVRSFWQFVYGQSGGDHDEAEKLAAAMVGRTRDGEPLAAARKEPIPGVEEGDAMNQFTFDQDPAGARCPFGAHIRRSNPRNADYPGHPTSPFKKLITMLGFGPRGFRDDLMSSVRFHRILRRGREYGSGLKPEDALTPDQGDHAPRGIHFICLNANISRQFEFIQNAWMASTKFSGLADESDPLVGTRHPIPGCPVTGNFTLQSDGGLRRQLTGLPQFVTMRGGAYFFLPGLRALQYMVDAGGKGDASEAI